MALRKLTHRRRKKVSKFKKARRFKGGARSKKVVSRAPESTPFSYLSYKTPTFEKGFDIFKRLNQVGLGNLGAIFSLYTEEQTTRKIFNFTVSGTVTPNSITSSNGKSSGFFDYAIFRRTKGTVFQPLLPITKSTPVDLLDVGFVGVTETSELQLITPIIKEDIPMQEVQQSLNQVSEEIIDDLVTESTLTQGSGIGVSSGRKGIKRKVDKRLEQLGSKQRTTIINQTGYTYYNTTDIYSDIEDLVLVGTGNVMKETNAVTVNGQQVTKLSVYQDFKMNESSARQMYLNKGDELMFMILTQDINVKVDLNLVFHAHVSNNI